jgi:hypothetical protein
VNGTDAEEAVDGRRHFVTVIVASGREELVNCP